MNNIKELIESIRSQRSYQININIPFDESHLVLNAMEKQAPKKVITDGSQYSTCDKVQYICPECNKIMLRTVCTTAHKPSFCYKCGQALDWSES